MFGDNVWLNLWHSMRCYQEMLVKLTFNLTQGSSPPFGHFDGLSTEVHYSIYY